MCAQRVSAGWTENTFLLGSAHSSRPRTHVFHSRSSKTKKHKKRNIIVLEMQNVGLAFGLTLVSDKTNALLSISC